MGAGCLTGCLARQVTGDTRPTPESGSPRQSNDAGNDAWLGPAASEVSYTCMQPETRQKGQRMREVAELADTWRGTGARAMCVQCTGVPMYMYCTSLTCALVTLA